MSAPTLLRPKRSAHAAIRGYLYQTCLGVLRWVGLGEGEALVFEGDEDLDRLMLANLEAPGVLEQVKAYQGKLGLGDRVVRESLRNFLVAFVALRERGEARRFVFTTTAAARSEKQLARWREPAAQREVVEEVRGWVLGVAGERDLGEVKRALTWLKRDKTRWRSFLDAVEWKFGAPEIGAVRKQIRDSLIGQGFETYGDVACDRLLWEAFEASSQTEVERRVRTRGDWVGVIEHAVAELALGKALSPSTLFRRVIEEELDWQILLDTGTLDLSQVAPQVAALPSLVLTAAYEVVPFVGRTAEIEELRAWCASSEPVAVFLETGGAGLGKTRLFIELTRLLREEGWHAGFVQEGTATEGLLLAARSLSPCLAIVDYAESRVEELAGLLQRLGQVGVRNSFRLALVARWKSGWWSALDDRDARVRHGLYMKTGEAELPPLVPPEQRLAEVTRAAAKFAEVLCREAPELAVDLPLGEDDFASTLMLHMAALAVVQGRPFASASELLRSTRGHERSFWRRALEDGGLSGFQRDWALDSCELCVTALTLVEGTTSAVATRELFSRALDSSDRALLSSVEQALTRLYRRPQGTGLAPLELDLLGEELVRTVLSRAPELLAELLAGATEAQRVSALRVLTRVARHTPGEGRPILEAALSGHLEKLGMAALEVAIRMGEPMDSVLAELVQAESTFDLADRMESLCSADQMLLQSTRATHVALAATKRALGLAQAAWSEPTEEQQARLARLFSNLGLRQNALGQRDAALASTIQALEIRRRLASQRPEAYEPGLAMTLNILGIMQSEQGPLEAALASTAEAVGLYRHLASQRPDVYEPDLAMSLYNLDAMLCELVQDDAALTSERNMVKLNRFQSSGGPENYEPDLARSFGTLRSVLRAVERPPEAAASFREGLVTIAWHLAATPQVFANLAGLLRREYLASCEAAGIEPDLDLLQPITSILERLRVPDPETTTHEPPPV